MPTWSEFIAGFGAKEIALTLFTVACIVLGREYRHIFRRGRDDKGNSRKT